MDPVTAAMLAALGSGVRMYADIQESKATAKQVRAEMKANITALLNQWAGQMNTEQQNQDALSKQRTELRLQAMRVRSSLQASAAGAGYYGASVSRALAAAGARAGVDIGVSVANSKAVTRAGVQERQLGLNQLHSNLLSLERRARPYNVALGALGASLDVTSAYAANS